MPIALSKNELDRIKQWTERDREDPEVVRRRELIKQMDATSKAMTKTWPNSVENVNKRNEELRRARIEAAEQANATFYRRYVRRQREQQQRLMHSARDTVFKNKDAPKLLLSAVIETCIQKERAEQVQFEHKLKRMEAERKRRDDDDVIRKAKEWNELVALKARRRFAANKQHQKEILEQAHEVAEKKRIEYESELKMQQIDNIQAQQQMDALKEFQIKFNAAEKARIWSDMEQARRENDNRRAEHAARDRMDHRLMEVLLNSRARVDEKRAQTEKDIKEEKRRVLESISAKLESGDAARAEREHSILQKAIREKEAIAETRRQAQAARKEAFRQDRRRQREQELQAEARRLHDYNTRRHFDIMNRFKNAELYAEYLEQQRNEKERKIKEFREETLRLWKERSDREARERAETRHFYGALAEQKIRHADNKLLAHAAELIEEARANNRPDHALKKAVDRYCKMYRLYPMPELPASLQEHFSPYAPRDGSRPDAPDAHPSTDAANGLQHPRSSTSNTSSNMEANVEDYKRKGRADGLQRKNEEVDGKLPPIAVTP